MFFLLVLSTTKRLAQTVAPLNASGLAAYAIPLPFQLLTAVSLLNSMGRGEAHQAQTAVRRKFKQWQSVETHVQVNSKDLTRILMQTMLVEVPLKCLAFFLQLW